MFNATAESEFKASQNTVFHKPLHTPAHQKEEIYSRFFDSDIRSTWYSLEAPFELPPRQVDDVYDESSCSFTIPPSLSFLKAVYMIQNVPQVEVAEEYKERIRIAWTPFLALAIVQKGVLHMSQAQTNPIDRHYIAIFLQYNTLMEHRKDVEYALGNRPDLTEFNTRLPRAQVGAVHPYYFYRLQNAGHVVKLSMNFFNYSVVSELAKLIRCQELINGVWTNTGFRPEYVVKADDLRRPQMFGIGTHNTAQEMSLYKCRGPEESREIYITDVFSQASTNATDSREVFSINRKNPTKCIFCVCENQDALRNNYYCNYTTNPDDHTKGETPVQFRELEYDCQRRTIDRTMGVMSRLLAMEHFQCTPWLEGYHQTPLCMEPFSKLETGVVLSDDLKAKYRVELNKGESKYVIRAYNLIQRCLRWTLTVEGDHIIEVI
jgi:hypothetical protein